MVNKKTLLLVDGHSLIHRAYHAFPPTLSTASGEQTNAVYGFTRMLLEAIHDLAPTHVGVAFDLPGPTFRETMFVGYKRSRVKPDDAMIAQIPRVKEVVSALGIPIFEVPGFEADDVIGTLCRQATEKTVKRLKGQTVRNQKEREQKNDSSHLTISRAAGSPEGGQPFNHSVVILTSDRDLMQLIRGDMVVVKMPERSKKYGVRSQKTESDLWGEKKFIEYWGFRPELLPDYKAFAGDQSDDIPGVRGIGEKTAKELVARYGRVNDVYESLLDQRSKIKDQKHKLKIKNKEFSESVIKKLAEDQEAAQMSKQLATIDRNVPIKLDWKAMEVHGYDKEKAIQLFDDLQFKSLVGKLPNDSFEESVQETLF